MGNSVSHAVSVTNAQTLVEALECLPEGEDRGFRFIASDLNESYLSYSSLRQLAARRAAALSMLGLEKGDRAALVLSDEAQFIISFVACVIAGVVPVPISPFVTTRSLDGFRDTVAGIVREARAKVLLTQEASRPVLEPLLRDGRCGTTLEGIATVETELSRQAPDFQALRPKPDDLCFLQFTSGSVTSPRGVMITHANLMTNVSMIAGPEGFGPAQTEPYPDLVVSWLPLFHDMGLIGCVLTSLISNVPALIISTLAFARDPRIWLREIHRSRGTITYAPNFAYALTAKRLRERDLQTLDLSSLRVAGCGGEPIHVAAIRSFAERLAPAGFRTETLVTSYGLAESTLAVTLRRLSMPLRIDRVDAESLAGGSAIPAGNGVTRVLELVSCGLPFHGHDLAVRDEDGKNLPERRVGEIVVKGPSVAAGYYENHQATTANWRDGWLHTGDLGYLADGELFVCGRLKDVIVVRGRKFYPNDIESSVRELPGIRHGNVVAFGVAAGGNEQLVIVAEADCSDADTLRERIAARVYESFGLEARCILLVPSGSLPKTTSGKLQRVKAKRLFEEGHFSDAFNSSERQKRDDGSQKAGASCRPVAPAQSI